MADPIAAGTIVMPAALTAAYFSQTEPILGTVESATPGTPPTAVAVSWNDGRQITYPVVGQIATAVLYQVFAGSDPLYLGATVQPTSLPNPGGRLTGVVTNQLTLADASGNVVSEVVVVKAPAGVYMLPKTGVAVLAAA